MRRLVMAPALLACLVVAAPAQAKVEQRAVAQSKSAVQSYWSAARMRNAQPADRVAGAGNRAAKPKRAAPWTSQEVTTPYTQQPTSTHGKVFFT